MRHPPLLERLPGLLRALPFVAFLGLSLLCINVGQMASVLVWPVSPRVFRSINRAFADWWWGRCVVLSRRVQGTRLEVTGDALPAREDALIILNHQSMADVPLLMSLASDHGRLGDLKWFVKDPLKWVPGIGWGMVFLDCIFVKRDWTKDQRTIQATFARAIAGQVSMWLISFSEGTRLSPSKLASSRAFAEKRGYPVPRHVQVPRPKGFVASVHGLRTHLSAVYDVSIAYAPSVPSLWQYAIGLAPVSYLHVRRYPIDELPTDDDELAAWLRERFVEKDAWLDALYARHGVGSPPDA